MNQMIPSDNNEIVMEGNLFYRYGMDQIELDGQWSLSSETSKCHFSYLLSSKQKVIPIHIDPKDLGVKDPKKREDKLLKAMYLANIVKIEFKIFNSNNYDTLLKMVNECINLKK